MIINVLKYYQTVHLWSVFEWSWKVSNTNWTNLYRSQLRLKLKTCF